MMFFMRLLLTLFICLFLSYLLGKPLLKALFPQASFLLYIPFGFVIYQVLFFFSAILFVYQHEPWVFVSLVASIVLCVVLIFSFMNFNFKEEVRRVRRLSRQQKAGILFLLFLGIVHGFLQVSFWNADNSMSDNSFYVSIATAAQNSEALFAINPADGMRTSILVTDYLMSTYEISLTYLAMVFGYHPAAFMRLIMPFWLSISTILIVFVIFQQLLQKDKLAYIGIVMYFIYFYFSPNYMSSLNDYALEEWFLYYYYVGKAAARYLVIPLLISLLIYSKKYFDFGTMTMQRVMLHAFAFNILGLSAMIMSPAASLYYLAIMFIYFLLLLVNERYHLRQVVALGLLSACSGIFGVLLSVWTKMISGGESLAMETGGVQLTWKTFLGIDTKYFNFNILKKFFISGEPFDAGWYPRWPHIIVVVSFFLVLLVWGIYELSMRGAFKKELLRVVNRKMPTQHFFDDHKTLVFFGIFLPIIYLVFYHLPPFVEIITVIIAGFGFERLVGAYPYEIMMIALLIAGFVYFQRILLPKMISGEDEKIFARLLTLLVCGIAGGIFIFVPLRPVTYVYAMSSERKEHLKFHDAYYNGSFNYQRLETNPYKLDYQAEQIVNKLSPIAGDKIVAGTINQFFGLSHVRNFDASIAVVRTRFSRYTDQRLADASYILRVYFSPWEAQFAEYHKRYSPEDITEALGIFNVNYLIVIKNDDNMENFGGKMIEAYSNIITHIDETEQYYILSIDTFSG